MPTIGTREDARNRCLRTLAQGVLATALVAAAGAVAATVVPGEPVDPAVLGTAVATTVLTAVAAYVQRRIEGSVEHRHARGEDRP